MTFTREHCIRVVEHPGRNIHFDITLRTLPSMRRSCVAALRTWVKSPEVEEARGLSMHFLLLLLLLEQALLLSLGDTSDAIHA